MLMSVVGGRYGVAVLVKDLFEDYYKTQPPVYTR
jgi:hypothetical protein